MTLSPLLRERLADSLAQAMETADLGHCLRVDHLAREDTVAVCRSLGRRLVGVDIETFVLDDGGEPEISIPPERAIEIRNRKVTRLCLFVPAELADITSSSLTNSFAEFDLSQEFQGLADAVLAELPPDIRAVAKQAHANLRGPAKPSAEDWADYLGVIAPEPTLLRAGVELWRLGLIPDAGGDGLADRLPDNIRCSRQLIRPLRAQALASERLDAAGVRPGAMRDTLLGFLGPRRLRDWRSWLSLLAEPASVGVLTFEVWPLETARPSDLESIEIPPFLGKDGVVERWSGLAQPGGAGTQPEAAVGPKQKVVVRWKASPQNPINLVRWSVRLVASADEHTAEEVADVEFPETTTPAKTRRAALPLDFELSELPVRAVRIRVTALDEYGGELRNVEGGVVEAFSEEFWLSDVEIPAGKSGGRRETVPCLPFARVKTAHELRTDRLDEGPGQWIERDLHYYSITLNGRRTNSVGLSPILRAIEERVIRDVGDGGAYAARIDAGRAIDPASDVFVRDIAALAASTVGTSFLAKRRDMLRAIGAQEGRGLVETVDWNEELTSKARAYSRAYRELLKSSSTPDELAAVMALDTVHLAIRHGEDGDESLLVMPTHPLRVAWYAAYADLLRESERRLLAAKGRRGDLDFDLLRRVAAVNCPAFVVGPTGSPMVFTQNLRFFWGVALPIGAEDPGRRLAEIFAAVGLSTDESAFADMSPAVLGAEIATYLRMHPYLRTLRADVVNGGSGGLIADALREAYLPNPADLSGIGVEDESEPTRVDLVVRGSAASAARAEFDALQEEFYSARPARTPNHLHPLFAYALQPQNAVPSARPDDVNLTIAIDQFAPRLSVVPAGDGDSSSLFGLITRFLPDYRAAEGRVSWVHRIDLPPQAPRERHPVTPQHTTDLVDTQREYLDAVGRLVGREAGPGVPAVVVELTPEDRVRIDALHLSSDWVITLDRFFGAEFYDDPGDADLARVARKYLLDYVPEFVDGVGHRLFVTTSQREEIEAVLSRAMQDLGFGLVEESVGDVLEHLKTISGRLALRVIGDDARAREAVSLGVVAAYLRARGELDDSILVPVDAHPELFGVRRPMPNGGVRARCDLIRFRFGRDRLEATFIEVKSRSSTGQSEELLNRIADQVEATEQAFRGLFFRTEESRLDHPLQRARLVGILRFYLARARRYRLIGSEERYAVLESAVGRLETGVPQLRALRWGFVVSLGAKPQRPVKVRDADITFITAAELAEAGLYVARAPESQSDQVSERAGGASVVEGEEPEATVVPPREGQATAVVASFPGGTPPVSAQRDGESSRGEAAQAPRVAAEPVAAEPVVGTGPLTSVEVHGTESATPEPAASRRSLLNVELGETIGDQAPVSWRPSVRGSPHMFILGIPGQGKSWTVARLLAAFADRGLPAVVFDFHGQFSDRDGPYGGYTPRPEVVDAARGIPFSPFETEADGVGSWQTGSFAIAEIFQYVCELGDIQRDIVYQAVRDSYLALGYGSEATTEVPTVDDVRRRIEELEQAKGVKNVLPRCRPILDFGLFRDGASERDEFTALIRNGFVLDVHALQLETLQLAAGAFLLRRIYRDMFKWGEATELRLAIVLDEAHRLARDITLPKLMKEGRKFGVVVVVASQGLADYHPDVVGNAGTKVVFRTNFPMSKRVAGFLRAFKGVDLAGAIEQLDVGEAYVQAPEMSHASRVRMHPLDWDA